MADITTIVAIGIICSAGITMNILAIITILKQSGLRKPGTQNILVLSLCSTNLLFSVTLVDQVIRSIVLTFYHIVTFKIRAFTVYVTVMSGIVNLLLITLNRYFIVVFLHQHSLGFRTTRGTVKGIIMSWSSTISYRSMGKVWLG